MGDTSDTPKRATIKDVLIVLGVLLAIGVPFLISEIRSMNKLVPTGHAATLGEFLEWQPAATVFEEQTFAGKRHIIAYGTGGAVLRSGPPAYVFDETGRLVDWSTDIGEDSKFCTRWDANSQPGPTTISRDAAEELAEDLATP